MQQTKNWYIMNILLKTVKSAKDWCRLQINIKTKTMFISYTGKKPPDKKIKIGGQNVEWANTQIFWGNSR